MCAAESDSERRLVGLIGEDAIETPQQILRLSLAPSDL
jgi:hypothetical protein